MIKIISGWSHAGGSTVAFINLTNELNKRGIPTVFYGPHDWHLNKCSSEKITPNFLFDKNDSIITHFINWNIRPKPIKKFIFSCHEKDLFPLQMINNKIYDIIHFVSEPQKNWHKINHPNQVVLPNLIEPLKANPKTEPKAAGIIGSIDANKQTHISIQKALNDGFETILIYGNITDPKYYKEQVEPIIKNNLKKIHLRGHCDDKQKMYDSVSRVYLSSKSETWGYIKKECEMTGTEYVGTEATKDNFNKEMSNEEIITEWIKLLEV